MIRRAPAQFGYARSRWTLALLLECCAWLRTRSPAGLSQLLTRLGIGYKRGRDYIHSPDPDYAAKVARIAQARTQARAQPEEVVLLYLDECTFWRQPSLAADYAPQGPTQPLARRSPRRDTPRRLLAVLDDHSGRVLYCQRSHITLPTLHDFWHTLAAAYPDAQTLYVVLDNWALHFHPDVLAPLQPQTSPWPFHRLAHWPTQPKPQREPCDKLPIQLLTLPTYASWLNPIEKLWRWLRQEVLHLPRLSHDWLALKQAVNAFLDRFPVPSPALLRYTGLLPP